MNQAMTPSATMKETTNPVVQEAPFVPADVHWVAG